MPHPPRQTSSGGEEKGEAAGKGERARWRYALLRTVFFFLLSLWFSLFLQERGARSLLKDHCLVLEPADAVLELVADGTSQGDPLHLPPLALHGCDGVSVGNGRDLLRNDGPGKVFSTKKVSLSPGPSTSK